MKKQASQMVYRIDLTPDRQSILFWTGIGEKKTSKSEEGQDFSNQIGYTIKAKLDDGFAVIGTRIELVEKEIRDNYGRFRGNSKG